MVLKVNNIYYINNCTRQDGGYNYLIDIENASHNKKESYNYIKSHDSKGNKYKLNLSIPFQFLNQILNHLDVLPTLNVMDFLL